MTAEMDGDDSPLLDIDPDRPTIVSAWGRKGSGKSYLNRLLFRSWPYDKIAIDVNGNALEGDDLAAAEKVSAPLPTKFPVAAGERRAPKTVLFRAHPGRSTYRDELDQAVGMALYPQDHRVLLWAGEVGELQANGRPGPHMRTLLMQNRHYNVTCLFDGPRPMYVDPLTLAQSDYVAVYELPNPRDQARIADSIGFPPKKFSDAAHEVWRRGDHWFLLWDSRAKRLYAHEPLPAEKKAAAA